jgi:hypothetical protein
MQSWTNRYICRAKAVNDQPLTNYYKVAGDPVNHRSVLECYSKHEEKITKTRVL